MGCTEVQTLTLTFTLTHRTECQCLCATSVQMTGPRPRTGRDGEDVTTTLVLRLQGQIAGEIQHASISTQLSKHLLQLDSSLAVLKDLSWIILGVLIVGCHLGLQTLISPCNKNCVYCIVCNICYL